MRDREWKRDRERETIRNRKWNGTYLCTYTYRRYLEGRERKWNHRKRQREWNEIKKESSKEVRVVKE